jgi:hypothetical protein
LAILNNRKFYLIMILLLLSAGIAGAEADPQVRVVAIWFVCGPPAAAQFRVLRAVDGATGSGADFHRAAHFERAILQRNDVQLAAAFRQGFGGRGGRFTGGFETGLDVRVVAERLVF